VGESCACIPAFCSGVATIIGAYLTEFIAVENRSHNLFSQFLAAKKFTVKIKQTTPRPMAMLAPETSA
jgi:hypothetical protein